MSDWASDYYPDPIDKPREVAILRAIANPEVEAEWQPRPFEREWLHPLAQQQTHRHFGCGHVCGDSHCVVSGYRIDSLCTPCVRKWALGTL